MTLQEAIVRIKEVDRFIDKNPSMFEYDDVSWCDYENALDMAIEVLQSYQKAITDLKMVCKMGADPCICCKYLENKGDQFPCRYGEWCGGETWEWEG